MNHEIRSAGVAGCGRMGFDLFLLLESCGVRTSLLGRRSESVERCRLSFLKTLDFSLREGVITAGEFADRKKNAVFTVRHKDLAGCDLVIEALPENPGTKREVLGAIDGGSKAECVFASCSSSIVPSEIAPPGRRRARTFGLHFFHPARFTGIVELIRPPGADDDAQESLLGLLDRLGKSHLLETEDEPFIANRALLPLQAQAYRFAQDGKADFRGIDDIAREHVMPHGVFEMFDRIGLDVAAPSVSRYCLMQEDLRPFAKPLEDALAALAGAGRFGQKSGRGFYEWKDGKPNAPKSDPPSGEVYEEIRRRLVLALANQVCYFVEKRAALEADVSAALRDAFGIETAAFRSGTLCGLDDLGRELDSAFRETGHAAFRPRGPCAGRGPETGPKGSGNE